MPALLRALRTSLPAQPLTAATVLQYLGGGGRSTSGVDVNPDSAMRNMAVFRAVNLTSGTVAGLPLKVYRDGPGVPTEGTPKRVEVVNPLFLDPMHAELDITWFEGIEFLVASMLLHGNGYALMIRNEGGDKIVRLLPIPATCVTRVWREKRDGVARKWLAVAGIDEPLTADEVLHIPGLSKDGICGMSPIDAAREAIGLGLAAEAVAASLFDSGLLNGGYLQAEEDLTDEQAALAKQRWRNKVGGRVRAFEVALLSRGFKYIPATIPPKDAQFLESRQFSIAEIARLYGMPPALLFEYMATGNVDAEKLGAQWVRFGLASLLKRVETRLSLHLLPRGTFCEFVADALLRGTSKEQAEVIAIEIDSGTLPVEEARALKNRPPLPAPPAPPPPAPDGGAAGDPVAVGGAAGGG
jgi:HK97 family phage portal protein